MASQRAGQGEVVSPSSTHPFANEAWPTAAPVEGPGQLLFPETDQEDVTGYTYTARGSQL